MEYVTLEEHLNQLVERHGSIRAVGRVTGVDYSYLSRLLGGERSEPGPDVLQKLGLKRHVIYSMRKRRR